VNLEKTKLKILTTKSIGQELEKSRDKAEKNIYRHQGAATALKKVEKLINTSSQEVRNELVAAAEAEELPFDAEDPMEVGKYVVGKLMAVSGKVHRLVDEACASSTRAEGIKLGLEESIKRVFKTYDEETTKLENIMKMIEEGKIAQDGDDLVVVRDPDDPNAPRPPGVHPGPPMKARRQEEESEAAEAEASEEDASA
jgi:hypothetical protein